MEAHPTLEYQNIKGDPPLVVGTSGQLPTKSSPKTSPDDDQLLTPIGIGLGGAVVYLSDIKRHF